MHIQIWILMGSHIPLNSLLLTNLHGNSSSSSNLIHTSSFCRSYSSFPCVRPRAGRRLVQTLYDINHTLDDFTKEQGDERKREKRKKKKLYQKNWPLEYSQKHTKTCGGSKEWVGKVKKKKNNNIYYKPDTVVSALITMVAILKHLLCTMGFSYVLHHPYKKPANPISILSTILQMRKLRHREGEQST